MHGSNEFSFSISGTGGSAAITPRFVETKSSSLRWPTLGFPFQLLQGRLPFLRAVLVFVHLGERQFPAASKFCPLIRNKSETLPWAAGWSGVTEDSLEQSAKPAALVGGWFEVFFEKCWSVRDEATCSSVPVALCRLGAACSSPLLTSCSPATGYGAVMERQEEPCRGAGGCLSSLPAQLRVSNHRKMSPA